MDGKPARTILLSVRYAAAGILRPALSILLIPIFTLYLSPADFGIVALLTISGTLVVRTIETPVASALQRFYFRPDYRDHQGLLLFNLAGFVLLSLAGILLLYLLAAAPAAALLFENRALAGLVRLHSLVVILTVATSLLGTFILLQEQSRIYIVASFVNTLVMGGVSAGLLATGWGVAAVIVGQAAGMAVQTLMWLPAFWRHAQPTFDRAVIREPLRFGYATLLSGYSNLLMSAGDRYVLRFLRTVEEVGVYSFGANLGNLVTLAIGTPVINGVWPTIRRMEENPIEQKTFIRRVTTFVSAVGVGLALAIAVFARQLIQLLSSQPKFAAAAAVVPLVAFAQALQGLSAFTEAGIILGNRPKMVSAVAMLSAATNVGLNFLLVPRWGILGAGWALVISYILWNALNLRLSARFCDLHFDVRRLAQAIGIGGGLAFTGVLLPATLPSWMAFSANMALVLAYPAVLTATGFLERQERQWIACMLRGVRHRGLRGMVGALTQP